MLGDTGCGEHVDDETEGSAKDRGLRPGGRGAGESSEPAARFPEAWAEEGVAGDFQSISEMSRQFVARVRQARRISA